MEPRPATTFMLIIATFFYQASLAAAAANATAVFAFGDSTVDPGNNNNMKTVARCNHPPYGRDFPNHIPTGRFTNGKLATDFIVSSLGLKDLLPAYLDPKLTNKDLLTGASFASAGGGLDSMTLGITRALKMSRQLEMFDEAVKRMEGLVGKKKATAIVKNAVFVVSIGTNDFVLNYALLPTRALEFTVSQYQDFLLSKIETVIKELYKAGARRLVVAGLPPVGCLPLLVKIDSLLPSPHIFQLKCITQHNADSRTYNKKLQSLISRLQRKELKGGKIAYMDIYKPIMAMIQHPAKFGCCGGFGVEFGPLCSVFSPVCPDASKYIFWDAMHPTQAALALLAKEAEQKVLPYLLG